MRRLVCYLLVTLLALSVTTPQAQAVVTPGAKCSKVGVKQVYKGKTYTCIKSGKKLVWNKGVIRATESPTNPFAADKAAAFVCIPNSNCPIGSKGPGGGIVFHDAGSQQSWGRYLEVAPAGWSGTQTDPEVAWCNITNVNFTANSDVPYSERPVVKVGKGKANTDMMIAFCSSGAGVMARAYNGGGKSDWYLPSGNELWVLRNYVVKISERSAPIREGFVGSGYWSSTEGFFPNQVWYQDFYDGEQNYGAKDWIGYVRPIRAF